MNKVIKNGQVLKIKPRALEKPAKRHDKYDSTIDERSRNYETRKPEPRFNEYR